MNPPAPKTRRGTLALLLSVGLHLAVVAWLASRPAPARLPEAQTVELEVFETPRAQPAPPAPAAAPQPSSKPAAMAAARPKAKPVARPAGEPPAAPPPAPAPGSPPAEGVAVADAPRAPSADLPRAGSFGQGSLAFDLSRSTAQALTGVSPEPEAERRPDAGPTEQQLVKSRVDSMLAEAGSAQRSAGAVDGAVAGLGRSFEQAARRRSFTPDLQRWVDAALKKYRDEAQRYGRLGRFADIAKDDSADTWARIEDRALRGVDRSEATYVAVVELRQASDGSLVDLRLVVSSGAQEFDVRALGSVADGLKADATAFGKPRPEGTLSLWALLGHRQTDSAALAAAQKAYRYALLDVVDLKPTVIDLERRGGTEQLRFSARLLAVY